MVRHVPFRSPIKPALRFLLAAIAAVLLALALAPAPSGAYPLWTFTDLDSLTDGPTVVALDADGHPHVAFARYRALYLAEWNGSAWVNTTAQSSCVYQNDDQIALAVRPDDALVAISFYDICTKTTRLAIGQRSGATLSWAVVETPTVANGTYSGEVHSSGVAIDAFDRIYLAFNEDTNVYYTRYLPSGGTWTPGTAVEVTDDAHASYWKDVSLVLDGSARAHISFDNGAARLTYARPSGTNAWSLEDVAGGAGGGHALVLASLDLARIAFHDAPGRSLKYATRDSSGTWTVTTVDTPPAGDNSGDAGQYPSLALDAAGNPHVAFRFQFNGDDVEGEARHAYWDGAAWQVEPVETGTWAEGTALAVDAAGAVHMTYRLYASSGVHYLRYAKRTESATPPAGPDTFIDSSPPRLTNGSATFTFHSDDDAATFQCRNSAQSWMACTSPHTSSPSGGDGVYTFFVRAVSGDVSDASPAFYTWTRDTTMPDAYVLTGPPSPSDSSQATFTFDASDASAVTFRCRVVPRVYVPGDVWPDFADCTSPKSFSGIDDGDWVFELMATDAAGNAVSYRDATFYWWTIDLPGPATSITDKPPALTNSMTATFSFTSDAPAATFQCQIDGGAWAACVSPASFPVAQGNRTFHVRATAAGQTDPIPASYSWTVDTTPPTATIDTHPPLNDQLTTATFTFHSNDDTATFECQLNGGGYAACATPKTYTGLAAGNYTFTVRARDAAGNVSAVPDTYSWYTAGPPQTTLYYPDPLPAYTTSTGISFLAASNKSGSTYQCRLDGAAFAACADGNGQTYSNLTPGTHTFAVRAVDSYSQPDPTPSVHTWVIDPYWPDTRIDGGPANPSNSAAPRFLFSSGSAGATFECRLDGGAWGACASPKDSSGLANGSHTFDVRATSGAGLVDPTPASYTWTITVAADATAPDTTLTQQPANPTNQARATYAFTSNDAAATFECAFNGSAYAPCLSPVTYRGVYSRNVLFRVRARDDKGNVDASPADGTSLLQLDQEPGALALGQFHACALRPDGSVDCWGSNSSGQAASQPGPFTAIAANDSATCGLRPDGSAHCWGRSNDGGTDQAGPFTQISGGAYSFCGVKSDNSVACWGWNANGQATGQTGPYTLVAAGTAHTCALSADGAIACWGSNSGGQLSAPTGEFYRLVSGYQHSCALKIDGSVDCWGNSTYGQNADQTGPYVQLTAGNDHNCGLKADGSVDCWGRNDYGQATDQAGPYVTLAAGGHFTCALRANGSVDCWGINPDGRADDQDGPFGPAVLDAFPPDTIIDSGPANPTEVTAASFTFRGNEYGATFECALDGAAFAACASPQSSSGLAVGAHTFQVRAVDAAGNRDATPAEHAWTISAPQPPETTIDSKPATLTNSAAASFTFSSSETGSTFECQLDTAAFAACTSPKSYSGLADGAHTFQVRAIDSGGTADPSPASYTWTVDTTAPDTTLTSTPANPSINSSASFAFSSESGATFECKMDGGSFAACTSPKSYTGLSDGSHTFQARAKDAAGNADGSPASYTWTIDTTPPDTTITAHPDALTTSPDASFSFNGVDAASFECQLDTSAFAACTSPKSYSGLSDGAHTFSVRARDAEGRYDPTPASYTWTIDLVTIDTTITTKPANPSNDATPDFAFTSNKGAYLDGILFYCQTDANGWFPCGGDSITYYNLDEGEHTFYVKAEDTLGNVDATPASWTWTMDLTAPQTTISVKPPAVTATTTATFEFSGDEPATFECKLDTGSWAACATPKSYSGLAAGSHTFSVRATDAATNVDASPASHTWTVDTTAPDTTLTSTPANPSASGDASFAFSSEAGATFECKLDTAVFAACTSPKSYSGLSDGSHTFSVRAKDAAGNTDATPASFTWTIDTVPDDTTPPETTIDSGPSGLTNSPDATFTFSGDDGAGSGLAAFECQRDSGGWATCASPRSFSGLSDGAHTFEVRAVDNAGNADPTPATRTWTVDTTPPLVAFTAAPADPSNDSTPEFAFNGHHGAVAFECQIDGGGYATCVSPLTLDPLADGPHTFDVQSLDEAGNRSAPASHTWTIDTTGPAATIDSAPGNPSNDNTPTFSFSAGDHAVGYQCRIDGGAYAACVSPLTLAALADGEHTFNVQAIDALGNAGQAAGHTWTVDATPPDTLLTAKPPNPAAANSGTFDYQSSEDGPAFACKLDDGPWAGCDNGQFNFSGLSDGQHTFQVRAIDAAGNIDPTPAAYVWVIDTTGPTVTLDSAPAVLANSPETIFAFSSEAGATFECRLDSGDWAACASPKSYSGLSDGAHTFDVRATDSHGITGPATSYPWTIDTVAPVVTLTAAPPALSNSDAASFKFTSEVGATFECKLNLEPWAACASPQSYSGLSNDSHTFSVRASDAAGNTGDAVSHTWVVDTAAPFVFILTAPPALANSAAAAFTFSADQAGSTFECQIDGGAWAACVSPKEYTGLADGSHTFRVRATDTAGNTGYPASHTWTIDTAAPVVTFTSTPPNPSSSATATFAFSSEPGATFEYHLDGEAWEDCTSPEDVTGLSEGAHTFYVRASDAAGNTGPAASYTWTVDLPAPPAIVYVTAAGGTIANGPQYQRNDILKWNGTAWSVWFDGAGKMPASVDIISFDVDDDSAGTAWMSFRPKNLRLPGLVKVQPQDIVYWDGSRFALFFDGSDVGLTLSGENINGLEVLPGSLSPIGAGCRYYLLISTNAGGLVRNGAEPQIRFTGEDVLGFCMTSSGPTTSGRWHVALEGQGEGLLKNSTLGLSANDDGSTLYFIVRSAVTVDGHAVRPSQVFSFSGGVFSGPLWKAADHGLTQQVDGVDVVGGLP